MPPDRFSPPNAFNINLLDSEALGTPDGLQTALRAIEEPLGKGCGILRTVGKIACKQTSRCTVGICDPCAHGIRDGFVVIT